MSLKEILLNDMKEAMKAKDVIKKNVITMLRSDIKNTEINEKCELDDDQILDVISKQVKIKQKALIEFKNANREDLVQETNQEILVLKNYLPQPLTAQELEKEIGSIIDQTQAKTLKDMGRVMSIAKKNLSHRADMQEVSALIKEKLQ